MRAFGAELVERVRAIKYLRTVTEEALVSAWILRTNEHPIIHKEENDVVPGAPMRVSQCRVEGGAPVEASRRHELRAAALVSIGRLSEEEQRLLLETEHLEELRVVTKVTGAVHHAKVVGR
jgi:hypothetical protein